MEDVQVVGIDIKNHFGMMCIIFYSARVYSDHGRCPRHDGRTITKQTKGRSGCAIGAHIEII